MSKSRHGATYMLYGRHACLAALENPQRRLRQAYATRNMVQELKDAYPGISWQVMEPANLSKLLTPDAVHQGIVLDVFPLPPLELEDVMDCGKPLILLDQVSDPHNVGAVLRSAAAFDAGAVIVHDRHAPGESGVMAKAASGALETVPLVSVTNIASAMMQLQKEGYWCIGMDGEATTLFSSITLESNLVIVLGAEGHGMRRLTAECCDMVAKLPMAETMESLNISNAAAIALYSIYLARINKG